MAENKRPSRRRRESSSRKSSSSTSLLQEDDDVDPSPDQTGYEASVIKYSIFYPVAVLPLCIPLLVAFWFPAQWIKLTCWRCSLRSARYVIVKDLDGDLRVETVQHYEVPQVLDKSETSSLLGDVTGQPVKSPYIIHRNLRYLYNEEDEKYILLRGFDRGYTCAGIHDMAEGLSTEMHNERLEEYGANTINVPMKSYPVLFVEEVLHPFYLMQVLSIGLWLYEVYYLYAAIILVMSTFSVMTSLIQTRRNMQQLHDMVKQNCSVTVIRDGRELHGVSGESLVPGDVMVIPPSGMSMPCDAVLLTGTAIVNEASLTGESIPITKTPLSQSHGELYRPDRHKHHTLFGGTQVIQTRFYNSSSVLAVVLRTAFSTSKGGMVRSILYPKPLNFKFYLDAIKFVLVLGVIALGGFCYTMTIDVKLLGPLLAIVRSLDIVTTVVPPALPAALTVGTVYALQRLKKQQIYCISPQRVNVCGKIKLVCFDKTGTLTEDSLDMEGVITSTNQQFSPMVTDPSSLLPCPLLYGMTTCHSLTLINGQLLGDPLDVKMFNSTGWTLEEPGEDTSRFDMIIPTIVKPPLAGPGQDGVELGIMKQFTFSSELQRMSVLVKTLPSHDPKLFHVYVKGAPEKIRDLCKRDSVPDEFNEVLASFTQKGMRVLAVGHRTMDVAWHKADKVERDMVECDLEFSGLIIMKNSLKPETTPVISVLKNANIRTVMVTGDNLLTAVSVARECGMVEPDHQAIMVKADSTSAMPSVTFHLLKRGGDLADLLYSQSLKHDHQAHSSHLTAMNGYQQMEVVVQRPYHLIVEGKSFEAIKLYFPDLLPRLLVKGTVFARMSPDQKAQLVTDLQGLGYGVGMCGDGANDCGALKAAHAGISLSEAEASVASPFTSKVPNITCVPKVIMEGRAALTTSFSVFKYMALYSLSEFTSVAILYWYNSAMGDKEYLYIDMVIVLAMAFVMGTTEPYPHLSKQRPPGTLAGVDVLFSVIAHVVLMMCYQVGILFYLKSREWFVPVVVKTETTILCGENTVIFQASIFLYVSLAVSLSTGPPYRKPLYTNVLFMLCLAVMVPCNFYLTLAPAHWLPGLWHFLQITPHPYLLFRCGVAEIALLYVLLSYTLESHVFHSRWLHAILKVVRCKRSPRNRYKCILSGLEPDWPPLGQRIRSINSDEDGGHTPKHSIQDGNSSRLEGDL